MSRAVANHYRLPPLVQGLVALLGLAFLAAAIGVAVRGNLLGAFGFLLVASLAGVVMYLARSHPDRPLDRQKRVVQIALFGILPLALIVQILAIII